MSNVLIWSFPHSIRVYETQRRCTNAKTGMSDDIAEYQVRRGRRVVSRHDLRAQARTAARLLSDQLAKMMRGETS